MYNVSNSLVKYVAKLQNIATVLSNVCISNVTLKGKVQ